jgi:hypothetical protein
VTLSISRKVATLVIASLAPVLLTLLRGDEKTPRSSAENAAVPATEIPFENAEEFPDAAYGLIAEARVLWLGEMHGTKEAPMLFLGLVRLIARHDQPPVVALEIPFGDQAAINDFMKTGDESILKSRTFFKWKLEFRDGRTSQAMAKLLQTLRTEKIVKIVCFDPEPAVKSAQERDEQMAVRLAKCAEENPHAKLVVLSGGVHSSVTEGTPSDQAYRPAGFELSKLLGPVATFELRYERGTIWAIMDSDVGSEHEISGWKWSGTTPYYVSLAATPARGHRGIIFSRKLTASPPWP